MAPVCRGGERAGRNTWASEAETQSCRDKEWREAELLLSIGPRQLTGLTIYSLNTAWLSLRITAHMSCGIRANARDQGWPTNRALK